MTRTERDGRIVPLATHYEGKQLNSPNDIVCAADGGIYFTDPPYGRAKFYGVERPQELGFQGVYRVGADPKSPVLLVDDFDQPNGLCFSLDGRRLFVNDTARKHIRVFDVRRRTARSAAARLWAETKGDEPGAPDGMKLDSAGNVYCCGPGGIHVFDPGREPARGHRSARVHGELRVGRRRLPLAVHHRLDVALPDPRPGPRAPRVLRPPAPTWRSSCIVASLVILLRDAVIAGHARSPPTPRSRSRSASR